MAIQIRGASSMRRQALGDVDGARDLLSEAAAMLPAAYRREQRGHVLAVVVNGQPTGREIDIMTWRTARVVAREQAELTAHAAILRPGRYEQKELLTIAYIEYLRRVDCDNHLLAAPLAVRSEICFEATARSLAQRATNLCRLVDPQCPDVAAAAFRSAGKTAGLRAAAFMRLSERAIVPSSGPGALPSDMPLRDAHEEAYRRACIYRDTTGI